MILTIFLVGIIIFCLACKVEDLQEKEELKHRKAGDEFIRKFLHGELNKNK